MFDGLDAAPTGTGPVMDSSGAGLPEWMFGGGDDEYIHTFY